jgi:hypothetical protein
MKVVNRDLEIEHSNPLESAIFDHYIRSTPMNPLASQVPHCA